MRCADDTALIADSEEKLQELLETVRRESEKRGLTINVKKTECMVIKRRRKKHNVKLKLEMKK